MKRRYKKGSLAALILAAALLSSVPAFAYSPPTMAQIATVEELMSWYENGGECLLTAPIEITKPVELSGTTPCTIVAIEHPLHISAGGQLSINNPKIEVAGPGTLIIVESGGKLSLTAGVISGDPTKAVITLHKGATMDKADAFRLHGLIADEANPSPSPSPSPSSNPSAWEMTALWYDRLYLPVGCDLKAALPTVAKATVKNSENEFQTLELALLWEDVSKIDSSVAGNVKVKGKVSEEELTKQSVSNPKNLTITLDVDFYKEAPISELEGKVMESTAERTVELKLPRLPEETAIIYIERQSPTGEWERLCVPTGETKDFRSQLHLNGAHHYATFRLPIENRSIRLRAVVEKSAMAGTSNEIELPAPPSDVILPPFTGNIDWDDGSGEGNRGGGGQSESDRDKPSPTPTAEVSPSPTPEAEPTPEIGVSPSPTAPEEKPENAIEFEVEENSNSPLPLAPVEPAVSTPENEKSAVENIEKSVKVKALEAETEPSPKEEQSTKPAISHGVVLVAVATVLGVIVLGGIIYFVPKRKP